MARRRGLRWIVAMLAPRPRLTIAFAMGLAAGAASFLQPHLPLSTHLIIAWDALSAAFIGSMLFGLLSGAPEDIRARAARDDEGRGVILGIVLAAGAVSLAAIALDLKLAKEAQGLAEAAYVAMTVLTVAASWFMVQLIFGIHYAHEYYSALPADASLDCGGLAFPGDGDPDYWDFLHFSVIIGVACQTADIAFTSKRMRRLGTVHGLAAFAYNTVIVALTINLLAGLVS